VILADTSIWVDHLRKENEWFGDLLGQRGVVVHPFVVGELALGHIKHFDKLLADLLDLPQAPVANPAEVLQLIKLNGLSGAGVGYVDAHLLASVLLLPEARLLTRDKRLHAAAKRMSIADVR
jgi:predicted nucleic acid-binding protein